MTDSTAIRCKLCGKMVPLKDMRFDKKGADLVCKPCYQKDTKKDMTFGKSLKQQRQEEKEVAVIRQGDELIHYICTACRFTFSRKKGSGLKLRCPYCGKNNIIENNQATAQDILNSV